MTDLPEKIRAWLWNGQTNSGQWHVNGIGETTAYIREDVELAMVAAVIEECLDRVHDSDPALSDQMRSECADKVDWQTAKDALDRLIAEAEARGVERERERCARVIEALAEFDPICEKCGKPKSRHNYRHPFIGPSSPDLLDGAAAIRRGEGND